ncbi:hypothetical protein D9611_006874 [Ephemerocybe angulata]|uniref:Uncharacterized protein n=2 Tax=Ephemerocybe angulata TaxID=980116 RepID=A0A8H5B0E0_9AGAR|nr:hypothetical protein D9611_006874 [Tulosesus angulatus]KAF6765966.1 ML domain-containing protein [Tulosesus angulatus]
MRWTPILAFLSLLGTSSVLASPVFEPQDQEALGVGPIKTMNKWEWENCGEPQYPIQIESLEVSPDPPQPGKNLTVKVTATVTERIEDGAYADVVVKLGLIKLLEKTFDVCEEARNANATVQCPVEVGPYVVEQTVELPKEIPRAKFVVNVNGYTAEDEDMLCLNLKVDFMKNPFPHKLW